MLDPFDKLFVVSDLHLGGPPGRRAFREQEALVWLIDLVRDDAAQRVALVINGDIFDFLAVRADAPEFNPHASRALREMATDAELQPIFQAWAAFLRPAGGQGGTLVLQIGNHDIELALPAVQQTLRELLGVTDAATHHQLVFETGDQGWQCSVGARRVHVLHGNQSDPWNRVDHAGLAAAQRALALGQAPRPPEPNAGTTMVCEVLNPLKVDYPFVDLLKPEDAPLMAVMEAVDLPRSRLGFARALWRRLHQGMPGELLQAEGGSVTDALQGPDREIAEFLEATAPTPPIDPAAVLDQAEQDLYDNASVRALATDAEGHLGQMQQFGLAAWHTGMTAYERSLGHPEAPLLRRGLVRWLATDRSFDTAHLAAIDRRIVESAHRRADVVIAGHTHLPKFRNDDPTYINTGTWMRVLKLSDSAWLASDQAFAPFFAVIGRRHTLQDLDKLGIDPRSRPVAIVDAAGSSLKSVGGSAPNFDLRDLP
jgi:UDP-2,3-diacylglucosamine pyrophosphatase LpxH